MSDISPNALSPKQLAKYHRQKCITLLEKITKNLFKMFRNTAISQELLAERFFTLYDKLLELKRVELYSEYHREMKSYIEKVAGLFRGSRELESMRNEQMTHLNRIQKLKNASKYKKDKHTKKLW